MLLNNARRWAGPAALALSLTPGLAASATDPPVGYYATATGSGATLKSQLHNIIDGHRVYSYSQLRSVLPVTDAAEGRPGYLDVIYDTTDAINNGSIWNREHTWPRSRGVGSSGPDNSDVHHLRPSFYQTNSDRGSLSFGGAYGSNGGDYGTLNDGGLVWYPGNEDAGRVARMMFYTAVRYDGSDAGTTDLELSNSANPGTNQLGKLNRLLEWHYAAPVDDYELARHERIYGYQNNRNPFVDRPEFAWSVFGDGPNDSTLYVRPSTGTPIYNGDGRSSVTIDFGRAFVGTSVQAEQTLIIQKFGQDGTYFSVTNEGNATSSLDGRHNAFTMTDTGVDQRDLTVGLSFDANTLGRYEGRVTIDNLDVTSGPAIGSGANDRNDEVFVSLEVIDHAKPSFSADGLEDVREIDLGVIAWNGEQASIDVDLFALPDGGNGPFGELTLAGIDVFEAAPGVIDLDLSPGAVIGGDDPMSFSVSADPSALGDHRGVFGLRFTEPDVPGARLVPAVVVAMDVTVAALGDANLSGGIEQGDLDAVLTNWGATSGVDWASGDFNRDGAVDQADLDAVLTGWGTVAAPNLRGVVVPEPAFGVVSSITALSLRRRNAS